MPPKNHTLANLENFGYNVPEPAPYTKIPVVFQMQIDYRKYRLRYRRSELTYEEGMVISQLQRWVNGMYYTLDAFDGTANISLFKFFDKLAEEFDAVSASEAAVVRNLTYYLVEEAKIARGTCITHVW